MTPLRGTGDVVFRREDLIGTVVWRAFINDVEVGNHYQHVGDGGRYRSAYVHTEDGPDFAVAFRVPYTRWRELVLNLAVAPATEDETEVSPRQIA